MGGTHDNCLFQGFCHDLQHMPIVPQLSDLISQVSSCGVDVTGSIL